MASRSRLGKGLGALFPLIPGDEVEESDSPQASVTPSASQDQTVEGKNSSTGSKSRRGPSADVSRETSAEAKKPHNKAKRLSKSSSTSKVSKDNISKERGAALSNSAEGKHKVEKRKTMPGFDELSHPSDVFFGVSRETEKNISEGAVSVPKVEETAQHSNAEESHSAQQETVLQPSAELAQVKSSTSESKSVKPLQTVAGGYLAEIAVKDIEANSQQPRSIFDEEELLELSHSIQEVGILQPIVVRKMQSSQNGGTQPCAHAYELIMGERRWRASQLAGLTTIPAIVKTTSDDEMLRDALLENLHRVALNPLEEAAAYQQMIEEFGLTQAQLSKSVSKSRPQIANMLRLLQLPGNVQKKVASGVLSAGHARALLGLQTAEEMESVANRIISEGLSVRSTEEIVALKSRATSQKPRTQATKGSPWTGSPVMQNLENHFETKINIKGTQKHGKIEITFSSPEDMTRIVSLMLGKDGKTGNADDTWV